MVILLIKTQLRRRDGRNCEIIRFKNFAVLSTMALSHCTSDNNKIIKFVLI